MDGEQSASLRDKVARATEDVARRVQHEVAGRPVVSSTRERAQGAAQAAFGVLPATREDVARLQESLDRIEAALIHLTARVDTLAKPASRTRRVTASAGGAKAKS